MVKGEENGELKGESVSGRGDPRGASAETSAGFCAIDGGLACYGGLACGSRLVLGRGDPRGAPAETSMLRISNSLLRVVPAAFELTQTSNRFVVADACGL